MSNNSPFIRAEIWILFYFFLPKSKRLPSTIPPKTTNVYNYLHIIIARFGQYNSYPKIYSRDYFTFCYSYSINCLATYLLRTLLPCFTYPNTGSNHKTCCRLLLVVTGFDLDILLKISWISFSFRKSFFFWFKKSGGRKVKMLSEKYLTKGILMFFYSTSSWI